MISLTMFSFIALVQGLRLGFRFKYLHVLKEKREVQLKQEINTYISNNAEHVMLFGVFYCLIYKKYNIGIYKVRSPPWFFISKNMKWRTKELSDWIKIRVEDFYKNCIGDAEYVYVSPAVYEVMANTFRKEAHAEYMQDIRNRTAEGYTDGSTDDLLMEESEPLEDLVIRQLDIEILQKAMQDLTEVQKKRLHMYFFEGLSLRNIAKLQHTNRNAVWKSIQGAIKNLKKFYD